MAAMTPFLLAPADVPSGKAFAYLGSDALAGFGLLAHPLYIYSFVTEKIYWSNAAARAFWNAESAEELHGRLLTPYSSATRARLNTYLDAFRRGEVCSETWTYYPKGQAVAALVRCTGVRVDGHDEAMLVELPPLSSASLPERELRALEALRHTPLMISLFAENGSVLMRNPAAEQFLRDSIGHLPDDGDQFGAMFAFQGDSVQLRAAVAAKGMGFRTAMMAAPGAPVHAVQVTKVSDSFTGLPALLVAQNDISQTIAALPIAALQQLAASEDALDSVLSLNALPALVLSVDDGRVLKANLALDNIIGSGVVLDEKAYDLFDDKAAFNRLLGMAQAGGGGEQHLCLKTEGEKAHWVHVSVAPITYERQQAVLVFITDVNWLYQVADGLQQELGNQREVAQMQRRILAVASHDLRTPLAVIDSVAQRLQRQSGALTAEEMILRATRIRETVGRMVGLLDNTLERVNGEVQALACRPMRGQLAESIVSVVRSFEEREQSQSITVRLPVIPEFHFDKALIEQALGNIIDNAIKYSRGRPVIEITANVADKHVQLYTRDHGVGIPEEEWGLIFCENKRGSNVSDIKGTGLGLSIVRQIINLHDGEVDIMPVQGAGAMLRITLPMSG